jgi:SAM-dependent methyltransferase
MDRSRIFFRLAYLFGFKPWDSGRPPPELLEVLEDDAVKPGRALDLGCGTGTNVIELARRGWQATGVDFTPRAIKLGRRKARAAGVEVRLLVGDVTRLRDLGVDGPFDLLLDLGCFHSVPADRRDAYVAEAARVAAPGATFLMFAFAEGPGRGPNAPPAEVQERFQPDFDIDEVRKGDPRWGQHWYFMRRRETSAARS